MEKEYFTAIVVEDMQTAAVIERVLMERFQELLQVKPTKEGRFAIQMSKENRDYVCVHAIKMFCEGCLMGMQKMVDWAK